MENLLEVWVLHKHMDDLLGAGQTADNRWCFDHDQSAIGLKEFFYQNFDWVDTFVLRWGFILRLDLGVCGGVCRIVLKVTLFFHFYNVRGSGLGCPAGTDDLLVRAFILDELVQRSQAEKRCLVACLVLQQGHNQGPEQRLDNPGMLFS